MSIRQYLYQMELDTPLIHFSTTDNLLACTYKKDLRINLEMAKEIVSTPLWLRRDPKG